MLIVIYAIFDTKKSIHYLDFIFYICIYLQEENYAWSIEFYIWKKSPFYSFSNSNIPSKQSIFEILQFFTISPIIG